MSDGVGDSHREARLALDGGDLEGCAGHVARALAQAPASAQTHELLAKLAAGRADGGVGLFPLDGDPSAGTLAAHAHLLAAAGHPGRALQTLARATAADPTRPWAGVSWVSELDVARIPAEELVAAFNTVVRALPERPDPALVEPARPYLEVARRALAAHPGHAVLHGAASGVARRLGEPRLALTWAQRGVETESNLITELWWANALYGNGQLESAIAALRVAERQAPGNPAIQCDLARWLSEAGEHEEAVERAEAALAAAPGLDCVHFTAHCVRFADDRDPEHLVALADLMREHPALDHPHGELAASCEGLPWLGSLPLATEVLIKSMRSLKPTEVPVNMGVSTMEAPSAAMTLRRAFPLLALAMSKPSEPDPRLPLRPGVTLWHFDGTKAAPALEPPRRAATLDGLTWAPPPAMHAKAASLADFAPEDLLATLVHPPANPSGDRRREPSLWERTVQVWCCLGLLHHRTDEPWVGSTRRRLLVEIAYGVEDWTTEAALYALVAQAWVDPACRGDVAELVDGRFRAAVEANKTRSVTILKSLAHLAFITPAMPEKTRRLAQAITGVAYRPAPPSAPQRKSFVSRLLRRS